MFKNFWIKNYFGGTFSHLLAFNMPGWYRGIRISPYQATVFVIWQGPTSGPFQMLQLDIEICEYFHYLLRDSLCLKQGAFKHPYNAHCPNGAIYSYSKFFIHTLYMWHIFHWLMQLFWEWCWDLFLWFPSSQKLKGLVHHPWRIPLHSEIKKK